ncbi:high mobility group box domain-containing protein [Scheffersomyces coipomensis]|uniref:high mobility group box domain-containing protein n=1 Tax=Scheffersomyces coipomensis TaxID=1788519 RepID=UPI00315D85BE
MSDVKAAKDSLVASLFELSKAAQDAAAATVNFYKVSHEGAPNVASLSSLSETLKTVASAVKGSTANGSTKASAPAATPATTKTAPAATTTTAPAAATAAATTSTVAKTEDETKTKKKKVERDPNAPKKPLTIYFAFLFHNRERIKEEFEKKGLDPLSVNDMNELIKEKWNNITSEEKAKWQKKYANELKEYQKEKEKYKATLAAGGIPPPRKNEPTVHSAPVDDEPESTEESPKKKEKKRKSEKLEKSKDKKVKK